MRDVLDQSSGLAALSEGERARIRPRLTVCGLRYILTSDHASWVTYNSDPTDVSYLEVHGT